MGLESRAVAGPTWSGPSPVSADWEKRCERHWLDALLENILRGRSRDGGENFLRSAPSRVSQEERRQHFRQGTECVKPSTRESLLIQGSKGGGVGGPRRLGQMRLGVLAPQRWGDVSEDVVATAICDLNDGLSVESSRGRRGEGWEGAHGNHVEGDFVQLGFYPRPPQTFWTCSLCVPAGRRVLLAVVSLSLAPGRGGRGDTPLLCALLLQVLRAVVKTTLSCPCCLHGMSSPHF